MSDNKFTPGPWEAVNCGKHWNNEQIDNWQIHWSDDGECVVDHVYEKQDAHLIAAAPELLQALESLRNCIMETRGIDATAALIDADKAIAKAKGESQ